jgi:metallo-beta-lactamase class B
MDCYNSFLLVNHIGNIIVRQKIFIAILFFVLGGASCAQAYPDSTDKPLPPFRIAGNLYYVGNQDLTSFLVVTPKGNILINSNFNANVPMIQASIEKLGFKFSDTKILLISHAHADHSAGAALVKSMTGAKYMVMDKDVLVVESGGKTDFQYGNDADQQYQPLKVDRVLHDGSEVKLGGTTLVAHLTPGHTKGCTTWTMKVADKGKTYNVVIVGSPNLNPGYILVNSAVYPQIAKDYQVTMQTLRKLPCDIFLGAHGVYFNLLEKYAKMKKGVANPFVDPAGYQKFITEKAQIFHAELARQQAALS